MSDVRWTDSQRAAIETTGTNVLVSAGAGSGKTAVLAERCARLMADESTRCGVERFLVVTFTDAAAAEMRERIGLALRRRLEHAPDSAWLSRQIAMLDSAAVSTLHSFCRRTLNRHFADVDLEPQAPLLDENEAAMLRRETAKGALDVLATAGGARGDAVLAFLGAYGSAGDRRLLDAIEGLNAFVASLPDPEAWCADSLSRYEANGKAWRIDWLMALRSELSEQLEALDATMAMHEHTRGSSDESVATAMGKLLDWVTPYRDALALWRDATTGSCESMSGVVADDAKIDLVVCQISEFKFERMNFKQLTKDVAAAAMPMLESLRDELKAVKEKYFEGRLRKEFGGTKWSQAAEGIQRIAPHIQTFFAIAARARDDYAQAKRSLGSIDFSDLERFMLDLLAADATGVARRLRDRFEHVLVDEFQDINPVQAEIIRLVSREDDADRPGNLFCVGDVKQSIYRFRLAEPRVFMKRAREYGASEVSTATASRGTRIDLVENFRSRPAVLEAVNAVFEQIMSRDLGEIDYDDRARLKPGRPADGDAPFVIPVELHLLEAPRRGGDAPEADAAEPDEDEARKDGKSDEPVDWLQIEREAYVIGERIRSLAADGVRYGDIVVLLRSLQPRAGTLVRTLSRMGVPVSSESDRGLLEALEARDVLGFLSLLDNLRQDIPLAAVMRSPLLGDSLSDDDLALIRASEREMAFCEAVMQYASEGDDAALRQHVERFLATLEVWRERARQATPADLLWRLYEETGYLAYVSGLRDGAQRRANLVSLHELARQFGSFQRQGLRRFLEFVAALRDSERDLARGSVTVGDEDAVRVMSIHRSKGLEFPVVIIGELGKRINFSDAREAVLIDRRLGIGLKAVDLEQYITYPTVPYRMVARSLVQESLAEELRVLYVAMTRAEQRIIMVGSGKLESVEVHRRRFTGRAGPLPLLDRRSARSMLDWVLPAICTQSGGRLRVHSASRDSAGESARAAGVSPPLFEITTYAVDDMSHWQFDPPERSEVLDQLNSAAAMGALRSAGPADGADIAQRDVVVQVVRRRLTTPYAQTAMTRIPAVASASALKRRWETRHDVDEPAAAWSPGAATTDDHRRGASPGKGAPTAGRPLVGPRFASTGAGLDANRRGTLTHELMQRLDLTCPCDELDVREQLAEMTKAGLFEAGEAGEIDIASVAWFFSTDLGRRMRKPGARVKREWPFVLSAPAWRYDSTVGSGESASGADAVASASDQLLVRGIIDCFVDAGEGWEIVDYKTDAVSGSALAERAALYRGQLAIYAEALAATFPESISRGWLVFLTAREIVSID